VKGIFHGKGNDFGNGLASAIQTLPPFASGYGEMNVGPLMDTLKPFAQAVVLRLKSRQKSQSIERFDVRPPDFLVGMGQIRRSAMKIAVQEDSAVPGIPAEFEMAERCLGDRGEVRVALCDARNERETTSLRWRYRE
jgi:hypothetical protein